MSYLELQPESLPLYTYNELLPALESSQFQPENIGEEHTKNVLTAMNMLAGVALKDGDSDEFEQWHGHATQVALAATRAMPKTRFEHLTVGANAYGVAFGHEPSVERIHQRLARRGVGRIQALRLLVETLAEEDKPAETWIGILPNQKVRMHKIYLDRVSLMRSLNAQNFHPVRDAQPGMREAIRALVNEEISETHTLALGGTALSVAPAHLRPAVVEKIVEASRVQSAHGGTRTAYAGTFYASLVALSDATLSRADRQKLVNELHLQYNEIFEQATSIAAFAVSAYPIAKDLERLFDLEAQRRVLYSDAVEMKILTEPDTLQIAAEAAIYHGQAAISKRLISKIESPYRRSQLSQSYAEWAGEMSDLQPDDFAVIANPAHGMRFAISNAIANEDLTDITNSVSEFMAVACVWDESFIISALRRITRIDATAGIKLGSELLETVSTWSDAESIKQSLFVLQTAQGVPDSRERYAAYLRQIEGKQTPAARLFSAAQFRLAAHQII